MAIEKNNFKVFRFDPEFSPGSGKTMSSEEDELQPRISNVESDDDEFDDADSGAGSDDFDLLELGESGVEFCQVGNQTCSIPYELYDLPGLEDILSMDVWNELLSEEDRFELTKFLPDMDQENFMITLKELFTGCNFHFGSPIKTLFDMLKGGLCEPRVALYCEVLKFFQKRQHYHLIRKRQNNMVKNLCQIRDAWLNCKGYSIDERLRVLNIMRSQKTLMYEKMEGMATDSSDRESSEEMRSRRIKDRRVSQKTSRSSVYGPGSDFDFPEKLGKQNSKGALKLAGSKMLWATDLAVPLAYYGMNTNYGPQGSAIALRHSCKLPGYDSGVILRKRDHMRSGDDVEESTHEMQIGRDRNVRRDIAMDKSGDFKVGKKQGTLRDDDTGNNSMPMSSNSDIYGGERNAYLLPQANGFTTKLPNMKTSYEFARKAKYPENVQQLPVRDQIKYMKGRVTLPLKGARVESTDRAEPFWHDRTPGEDFTIDSSLKSDDRRNRSKTQKIGRESPDLTCKSFRSLSSEKVRGKLVQNGGPDMSMLKGSRMFIKGEETESDSSEHFDDDDDDDSNLLLRSKLAYTGGVMEASQSSFLKSGLVAKKAKDVRKDIKENTGGLDVIISSSSGRKVSGSAGSGKMLGMEGYSLKTKQKGVKQFDGPLQDLSTRVLRESHLSGFGRFTEDNDRKPIHKMGKNGLLLGESGERLQKSSLKAYLAGGKQKGKARLKNLHDEEDDALDMQLFPRNYGQGKLRKKGQGIEAHATNHHERSEASLMVCNSANRKRKGKEHVKEVGERDEDSDLQSNLQQIADSASFKKKSKRKLEAEPCSPDMEKSRPLVTEPEAVDMDLDTKPQKKPFTLIMPTVHTGFSFSIIHLLSAVRLAMITPLLEDALELTKPVEEENEGGVNGAVSNGNVPHLTVQEIIDRVRSNPGDPCVLETQEPLQDLVRGVLKLFSSKTAPLGAKGWKTLAAYEKSTKTWSWIGPVSQTSSDHETVEEVVSSEAWGLPHKMLVKLVDSFANWLKSGQETLQQIGSLPAPPMTLMQSNLDEKERFRDLRAQKSLNTINPSSEEVRAYFRREEVLRYSIPDRAFSYTAADGTKSIVAPLRRCGGKPTSKARDHFMLKRDRPPHVTILCLVRDAAARLPGSIGTRADVCTLIRDSQYIVEDVSDSQVNQVVSGALDRLHYERDPCVQFDGERKLWVYLHREREEEDFEDDGTSSTKKWKRQKKDAAEQSEQGTVTVAYHGTDEQSGYDLCSDLNAVPRGVDDDKGMEHAQTREDNVDRNHGSNESGIRASNPMFWESLALNPTQENKLLCQENSTNEDFDDETFGRERPVELLSASIL